MLQKRGFWKMPLVLAVFGLAFAFVLAGCDSGSSTTGTVQRTVTFNANGGNFGGSKKNAR